MQRDSEKLIYLKQIYEKSKKDVSTQKKLYNAAEKKVPQRLVNEFLKTLSEAQRVQKYNPQSVKMLKIVADYPTQQYQIDFLYEKNQNKTVYILVVIDVFSRYLWLKHCKQRTLKEAMEALEDIFFTSKYVPENITADNEFNKKNFLQFLDDWDVRPYFTELGEFKDSATQLVERVNRTIREKILRYKLKNAKTKKKTFLPALQEIAKDYNETVHTSLGITPYDAFSLKDVPNPESFTRKTIDYKINVGDSVRLLTSKTIFTKKSATPNWSEKVYTVKERVGNTYYMNETDTGYKGYQIMKVIASPAKSNPKNKNPKLVNKKPQSVNKKLAREIKDLQSAVNKFVISSRLRQKK